MTIYMTPLKKCVKYLHELFSIYITVKVIEKPFARIEVDELLFLKNLCSLLCFLDSRHSSAYIKAIEKTVISLKSYQTNFISTEEPLLISV